MNSITHKQTPSDAGQKAETRNSVKTIYIIMLTPEHIQRRKIGQKRALARTLPSAGAIRYRNEKNKEKRKK